MNQNEIERRLTQLESNLIALATRQGNRANEADEKNSKTDSKVVDNASAIATTNETVDELILTQADMLFDVCLLEMGIDATEFFDEFDLEEDEENE